MTEKPRPSALWTVFLVVLIDLLGFGIVLPLLPFYASQFQASPVGIGLLYSVYSFAQLVFSPFWGRLSDRVGRRPVMLLSTAGAVFGYLLFALSNSLAWLFASRLLAGIMGGNISTAQAYVADVTGPSERARGMGLIGAAFGIGFTAGPALASWLIHPEFSEFLKETGIPLFSQMAAQNRFSIPGFFAAFLSAASFLMVLFRLPETVHAAGHPRAEGAGRAGIFNRSFWSKHSLRPLFFSVFLLAFGQSSLYGAFPLFCGSVLGLAPERVGYQFAYMGMLAVVVQGGLIRPLEKKCGERNLFLIGSILMVTGLGLIPFAVSERTLTLYLGVMALGASLNGPTLNSMISKQAPPAEVGAVMGRSQGLAALGRVIGPAWGGLLYSAAYPAPFLATAALVSLTIWTRAQGAAHDG